MVWTVEAMLRAWLDGPVKGYRESSQMAYRLAVERHMIPALGRLNLEELDRKLVENWIEGLRQKGLSEKTVREINAKLTAALQWSVEMGMLGQCGFSVKLKVPAGKQPRLLTEEEKNRLERFLMAGATSVEAGFLLCLWCGLTAAELSALKWGELDLDRRTVTVRNSMQRVAGEESGHKTCLKLLPQKERSVPIPPALCEQLSPLKRGEGCFFLTGEVQKFVEPRLLQTRWKQIKWRCGLPESLKIGCLRDSFIARGLQSGLTPAQMSRLTGRKNQGRIWEKYGDQGGVRV